MHIVGAKQQLTYNKIKATIKKLCKYAKKIQSGHNKKVHSFEMQVPCG